MSIENRIKQVMAESLKIAAESIDADTASDNVGTWDSLAHVNMVSALEAEFDVDFTGEEVEEILSYPEILQAITSKVAVA